MSSSPYANAETHNQENWILGQKKIDGKSFWNSSKIEHHQINALPYQNYIYEVVCSSYSWVYLQH